MRNKKFLFFKDKTAFIQYLYIYVMMSSAGMALPSYMGNDNFIILVLLMGIFYVFFKPSAQRLQNSYLTFIGAFFMSMLLIVASSTLSIGTTFSITSILLIVYASFKIDAQHYIQRLIKLIYYIAFISIIIFAITKTLGFGVSAVLYPFLYPSFSQDEIYSYGGFVYRFVFLHSDRNCGPFGEPGQYQCVLSVALYFVLFRSYLFPEKERFRYLLVFFVALFTTLSTSGYIAMAVIIVCFLLQSKNKVDKRTKYLFWVMFICSIFFFSYTDLGQDFMNTAVYDKIYEEGQVDFSNKSGRARTESIAGVLMTIENNPATLWGVGYDRLNDMGLDGCAGLLFLLLAIGVVPYSILFGFSFYQVLKYNRGIWDSLVRILLVVNMGLGQPHIMNFALFTMILYPYFIGNKTTNKSFYVGNS